MIRAAAALTPAAPRFSLGPVIAIPLAEIVGVDPCNERVTAPSDAEIAAFAEQLRGKTMINPLILRGTPRSYRVLCGFRRYLAQKLLNAGEAAATIEAKILDADDQTAAEISDEENSERIDPHPLNRADQVEHAVAALGEAEVARRRRKTLAWVNQRVRLSQLPAVARDAWLGGRINREIAEALTVADDATAIEALFGDPQADAIFSQGAAVIRARLRPKGLSSKTGLARFVGEAAYIAAGGEIAQRDMFDEAAPDIWKNPEIAHRVADAKLHATAARLRATQGWGFAVFRLGDAVVRVEPDLLPAEDAELAAIEAVPAPWSDADFARREDILMRASLRAVPKADRHRYGVYVGFDGEGRSEMSFGVIVGAQSHSQPGVAPPAPAAGADAARAGEPDGEVTAQRPSRPPLPAPIPRPFAREAPPAPDAPPVLHAAARRMALVAASRALAEAIANGPLLPALRLYAAATLTRRATLPLFEGKGPGGRLGPAAIQVVRSEFPAALDLCAALTRDDFERVCCELLSQRVDLRELEDEHAAAVFTFALRYYPDLAELFATYFDYRGFFDTAGRAFSLASLQSFLGPAFVGDRGWVKDEELAEEAARHARALTWMPECLRGEP